MTHADRLDAGERDLGRRTRPAQTRRVDPGAARSLGRDEHAPDGSQPPVERELADRRVPVERRER